MEADATSIRKWKLTSTGQNVYYQVFALVQRPAPGRPRRLLNLFELSLAHARAYGKPPPESKLRIEQAKCFQSVAKKDAKGLRTLLITDGAPCYPALAKKYGLSLQQCNHSQGNFCRTRTLKNRGKVKIHTGHVDGFWKILKEAIPGSLPSKKGHARNPQIWKCMRSFQWRWECTDKNLMQTTADTLKKI